MMSSSTSMWGHRFSDDSERSVALYNRRQGDQPVDVGDILAATKSQLPYVGPEQLQFHGILGAGTSFKVQREVYTKPVTDPSSQVQPYPYFVAVKHMILPPRSVGDQDAHKRRMLYSTVSREIRVLMHPPLRDHCCIIPVLAYGWTNHPSEGANPYLIVDYSDHGTLTQYFRRCTIPLHERRELAVDVAVGIKVLHDNKIIHGDVKPDNILVFDSGNDYSTRPQTAKLADFGASLFEQDVESEASYLGTSIFNAPEIEGRPRHMSKEHQVKGQWGILDDNSRISQYKKADIYSFGLLLWETMKNGEDIIEKTWLAEGESELEFLNTICETESNGMLQRAYRFCDTLQGNEVLVNLVKETFGLALLDDASERADIEKIIESLKRGSDETRGPTQYPLARISPPAELPIPASAAHLQRAMPPSRQVPKARYAPIWFNPSKPRKDGEVFELARLPAPYTKENSYHSSQNFVYKPLDMFQVAVATSPPWNVQADIVDGLKLDVVYERDPVKRAEALLQSSICRRLGFGIEPNLVESMHYLSDALATNSIAQSVFCRVWQANKSVVPEPLDFLPCPEALNDTLDRYDEAEHFVRRVQAHQRVVGAESRNDALLSAAATGDEATVNNIISSENIDQTRLSEALLISCKYGQYGPLESLLAQCHKYHAFITEPTPLHWLIMFNEPEVSQIAEALINQRSGKASREVGICGELLGSMPRSAVRFPENCLELFGSPLHWAVRMRHLPLVQVLIKLGADVNLRWKAPSQLSSEILTLQIPDYSPLDLAVTFHCSDVVDILIAAGAETRYTGNGYQYSALHVIGQPVLPFAHDVLHGKHRHKALHRVIDSLKKEGCDINSLDSGGETPLAKALENPDLEDHVLAGLLEAGARVDGSITRKNENAAIIIARNSVYRRLTTSKLSMILPLIPNINEKDNGSPSWNALHHCAKAMSGKMTKVLLENQHICVDERTSDDQTALHIAATFGSFVVIDLLVRAGASLDARDQAGRTPLEIATLGRWADVVHDLIRLGASLVFTRAEGKSSSTVIHAATANANDGNALVTEILTKHDIVRENRKLLNLQDDRGWTALHQAAYYGDIKSVDALLNAGADRTVLSLNDGPYWSSTAFDIATAVLRAVSAGRLGPDHKRIRDGGPPAMTRFRARLVEIRDILKRGS
ncbi:MAG: hypothetical protein M1821_001175 [Bathelium mastoideum]|nr:MAG: hypothetical protein M1821_001175 [Bathelium mastoideum]